MGNEQKQKQSIQELAAFHQKFKKVQNLQHTNEMILSIPFQQKDDVLEWQKLLKNVKDCDPEFLLMPKKYMVSQQGMCGTSGIIKIVYDSFTYSFQEQIKNHAQKFKHFQQSQIWYLTFAIISSIKQMDRLSIKVGDIRPYNIFVNQNGQVKLSGVYSWPREVQNYLKTSYDKIVTYLAPQQLLQCRIGEKGKKSPVIGQSFSVGLTLLHTCLLKQMNHLYNLKKYQFSIQKLQQQINQLKQLTFWNYQKQINQKYSDQLINAILLLLELDESKRLSSLQLFDTLQPHAEQILNLRQFQMPAFISKKIPERQKSPNKDSRITPNKNKTQQGYSPQYSSIKKKQYNQRQSLGFDTNPVNGTQVGPQFVEANSLNLNNLNNTANKHFTPQKISSNKQQKQQQGNNSRSPQKNTSTNIQIHPRTSYGPRQSSTKQKYLSNPSSIVKFNTNNNIVFPQAGNNPSINQPYVPQTILFQTQQQRPSFNINIPSSNYVQSANYISYQPSYQLSSQNQFLNGQQNRFSNSLNLYNPPPTATFNKGISVITNQINNQNISESAQKDKTLSQNKSNNPSNDQQSANSNTILHHPSNFGYQNAPATDNIGYKRISQPIKASSNQRTYSSGSFPFSQNVDLVTSGYTYVEKNNNLASFSMQNDQNSSSLVLPSLLTGLTQPPYQGIQTQGNSQQTPHIGSTSKYQASTVKPISFMDSNPFRNSPADTHNQVGGFDFLAKLDEQLNKSRQLYP